MLLEPPIEKLSEKVGSKYKLCVLASKRALDLQKRNIAEGAEPEQTELTEAANEIWEGKIVAEESNNK